MFSKKQEQNSPSAPTRTRTVASNNATFSVIGADVTITGDVEASADLHIDGTVEGDISCASLVQGEGSEIRGAVKAESAKLSGQVTGTIEVGQLTVTKSARIHGDVTYDNVTVEQGAQIDGRFSSGALAAAPASSDNDDAQKQSKSASDSDQAKLSLAG